MITSLAPIFRARTKEMGDAEGVEHPTRSPFGPGGSLGSTSTEKASLFGGSEDLPAGQKIRQGWDVDESRFHPGNFDIVTRDPAESPPGWGRDPIKVPTDLAGTQEGAHRRLSYRAFIAQKPSVFAIPKSSSTHLAAFSAEQVLVDRVRTRAPRFPTEIGTSRPLRM